MHRERGEEIVLPALEQTVVYRHPRGYHLYHATLHQLLSELGILQLLAYRHP